MFERLDVRRCGQILISDALGALREVNPDLETNAGVQAIIESLGEEEAVDITQFSDFIKELEGVNWRQSSKKVLSKSNMNIEHKLNWSEGVNFRCGYQESLPTCGCGQEWMYFENGAVPICLNSKLILHLMLLGSENGLQIIEQEVWNKRCKILMYKSVPSVTITVFRLQLGLRSRTKTTMAD